jgi:DNA-directed RNA polymerase specialized sigma24 family protein
LTADQRHLILREAYRNYLTFEQYVTDTGKDVIEYAIPVSKESDEWVPIAISFTDLQRALKVFNNELRQEGTVLSKRKEQAFYLNVIRDMKQKEVAELMKITTVSVGQYVDQGMLQLAEYYFGESDMGTLDSEGEQESNG